MSADQPLRQDEIDWMNAYAYEVLTAFRARFESAAARFKTSQPLLDRFSSAIEAVQGNSRALFRAVDEAHNELCVASALLENSDPVFTRLEYEPVLAGCAKSIDFRATTGGGVTVYVDVKTIKPLANDRWEQFKRAMTEGWFPPNVSVVLSKEWFGGELWHNMFAARDRMLEYSLELEQKIAEGNLAGGNSLFVLALCGEGFSWHEDEFEDFVSYYYSGAHRGDDPFGNAEARYVRSGERHSHRKSNFPFCLYAPTARGHISEAFELECSTTMSSTFRMKPMRHNRALKRSPNGMGRSRAKWSLLSLPRPMPLEPA